MKQCSMCQEEFADKFTFCPIDGTPLKEFSAGEEFTAGAATSSSPLASEETIPSMSATNENFSVNETAASLPSSVPQESFAANENAGAVGGIAAGKGEYHLTIIEDAGITRRLMSELSAVKHQSQLTWPEFKRDPRGFSSRLVSG
ncbi:MAG TPA: hypothetical protein VF528_18040, partial [Pyrinomonadaceae bacterium]